MVQCDDGNNLDGDGYSASCIIEAGWQCSGGSPSKKDTCVETCGDGLNFYTRFTCDSGNPHGIEGCDANCQVEKGYTCS